MQIKQTPIDQIKPYAKNAKKHPEEQIKQVADSIKAFGFNQPIVVDKENVVIVGHGRLEAAKLLGLKEVPVLQVDLPEHKAKAYRLADNKLNESDWDMPLVIEELKELELAGFDIELTGFDNSIFDLDISQEVYTNKVEAPNYEPTEEKPDISELYTRDKTIELLKDIEDSSLDEKEKEFLRQAAQRHTVFNYAKIAEYYAHSGKETQELMEKSALVIIDFDKAIENGYVELSRLIEEQYLSEYGQ